MSMPIPEENSGSGGVVLLLLKDEIWMSRIHTTYSDRPINARVISFDPGTNASTEDE
jgi:hypothetical protein